MYAQLAQNNLLLTDSLDLTSLPIITQEIRSTGVERPGVRSPMTVAECIQNEAGKNRASSSSQYQEEETGCSLHWLKQTLL